MPSRQPGAAIARARGRPADEPPARLKDSPDDTPFAPPPPESLRRVLDGLRNLN